MSSPMTRMSPAGTSLPPAACETVGRAPVERVVFLAAVHADDGPHPVVVRIEGHARRPRDAQDGQLVGVVQWRDAAELDRADRVLERVGIGDELGQNVAHREHRRVLTQRTLAAGDDVVDGEYHERRLRRATAGFNQC